MAQTKLSTAAQLFDRLTSRYSIKLVEALLTKGVSAIKPNMLPELEQLARYIQRDANIKMDRVRRDPISRELGSYKYMQNNGGKLSLSKGYSWDSKKKERVFTPNQTTQDRIRYLFHEVTRGIDFLSTDASRVSVRKKQEIQMAESIRTHIQKRFGKDIGNVRSRAIVYEIQRVNQLLPGEFLRLFESYYPDVKAMYESGEVQGAYAALLQYFDDNTDLDKYNFSSENMVHIIARALDPNANPNWTKRRYNDPGFRWGYRTGYKDYMRRYGRPDDPDYSAAANRGITPSTIDSYDPYADDEEWIVDYD